MSLAALTLYLSLQPAAEYPPETPEWWGRGSQAALLKELHLYSARLAEELHDGASGLRPYTATSLLGFSKRRGLEPGRIYRLRWTSLRQDLSQALAWLVEQGGFRTGSVIHLDDFNFTIQQVELERQTYEDLSASYLLAKIPPERQLRLRFTSPTVFKTAGRHLPLPLPELVFGSLLERWNSFAPVTFPDELKRFISERLLVSRYKISSQVAPVKAGGLRIGAVGEMVYTSANYDRYWLSLLHTLAAYARYAGVGAGTTQGLGQCEAAGASGGETASGKNAGGKNAGSR